MREWPDPPEMRDVVSLECFANYLKNFTPDFDVLRAPLAPCRKRGSLFADLKKDKAAALIFHFAASRCR